MCDIVLYGDVEYDNVGELRKLAPKIVGNPDMPLRDLSCLCSVDIPATAAANGFDCADGRIDSVYPFGWVWTTKEDAQ